MLRDVRILLAPRGAGGGRPDGDPGLGGGPLQTGVRNDPDESSSESAASVCDSSCRLFLRRGCVLVRILQQEDFLKKSDIT